MEKMTVDQFVKNCEERNKVLEGLLEKGKVKEFRRVYSINLASFLASRGYTYVVKKDEDKEDLYFFVFKQDLTELIVEYKNNFVLQDFIRSYRDVKKKLHIARKITG